MKSSALIKRIFSKRTVKKVEDKVLLLGSSSSYDVNKYLNNKLFLSIIIFILILVFNRLGYLIAPIVTFVFYFIYDYVFLDVLIKKRASRLEHDAIFFFEILALTLQSERNLKTCLAVTTEAIDSELSTEFKTCLEEVKLGKSLTESLNDTKKRIPSKAVNNVLLNIVESNMFGNSIVDSINNQVEYLTDKRILDIKGQINKLPTKISILSVLFFVPLILLLIIGPVFINYFFK